MKTTAKNTIVTVIEALNEKSENRKYVIENLTETKRDGRKDYTMDVYEKSVEEDGSLVYRTIISDPTVLMSIANELSNILLHYGRYLRTEARLCRSRCFQIRKAFYSYFLTNRGGGNTLSL